MPRNTAQTLIIFIMLVVLAIPGFANQQPVPAGPDISQIQGKDLFYEGFEDGWLPAGWSETFNNPTNWDRTNYKSNSGSYSAYNFWAVAPLDNWLVTPALDLSQLVNPKLEFYEDQLNWMTNSSHHYIMYSTTSQTDLSTFSPLADWTMDNHTIPGFGNESTIVDLLPAGASSTVYIAFRYTCTGGTNDTWFIDDVSVVEPIGSDVEAISLTPDDVQLPGDELVTPQVLVKNLGYMTETFTVELQINQSGTLEYTEIVTVIELEPGHEELVDFPQFFMAAGQYYNLNAQTQLSGDIDTSNDSTSGIMNTYTERHIPLGMLWTNAGCMPCVQGNESLDNYMPGQDNNVALMRIHTSWPENSDPMYQANMAQSSALVSEFQIMGVPNFWVDATIPIGSVGTNMIPAFEAAKAYKSPLTIDIVWDNNTQDLTVTVNNTNAIRPESDLQLYCTITEDNVEHTGSNGEPIHMQVFRRMYPGTSGGQSVPATVGTHVFVEHCPLEDWDYNELRATVYVRDMQTGKIFNAATGFLTNLGNVSAIQDLAKYPFVLDNNYPNPFNPKTTISFSLNSSSEVNLEIFDARGHLVQTLLQKSTIAAGPHKISWEGKSNNGEQVPSGMYFYRLNASGRTETRSMVLLK